MKRGTWIAVAALAALACGAPARATVGGPRLLDVLGWSPDEKRVYVHVLPMDESGDFGDVLYFALDSATPEQPQVIGWSAGEGTTADDPELLRKLDELRGRLAPMCAEPAVALPSRIRVVSADTARDCDGAPRYVVHVALEDSTRFEVTTFYETEVVVKGVHQVPGRPERLVVLAFIGICAEGGYETQEPMLLAAPSRRLRPVPWEPEE